MSGIAEHEGGDHHATSQINTVCKHGVLYVLCTVQYVQYQGRRQQQKTRKTVVKPRKKEAEQNILCFTPGTPCFTRYSFPFERLLPKFRGKASLPGPIQYHMEYIAIWYGCTVQYNRHLAGYITTAAQFLPLYSYCSCHSMAEDRHTQHWLIAGDTNGESRRFGGAGKNRCDSKTIGCRSQALATSTLENHAPNL